MSSGGRGRGQRRRLVAEPTWAAGWVGGGGGVCGCGWVGGGAKASPRHPVGESARDEPEAIARTSLNGVRAARGQFTHDSTVSDPRRTHWSC